ncbi:Hsp70 family protein [Nocardia sp. alder85J]|uniref:Hsp70 family protein n=1 Tax=Nocardia sp. alder85J TaxID=2862949 RepID=UPI0022570515|nr:Hsp70 family protein [Nocardia sp. alder85J]MCX4097521.1 Hsp70 family protein [Nocardia sp. alder85J]
MAVGLGMSIGTIHTVCAVAAAAGRPAPQPATRRTTLTFDSSGAVRVGRIPRHGRMITDFADLTQRPAPGARVCHRTLTAADLVATVAGSMCAEVLGAPDTAAVLGVPRAAEMRGAPRAAEMRGVPRAAAAMDAIRASAAMSVQRAAAARVAVTHPVGCPAARVTELRAALDTAGLEAALLVAEPIAAAAWLSATHGPLLPGLALVYDLGGSGLSVTLVRVGAGLPPGPIVGTPVRSAEFGGRAFGAEVSRRAARLVAAGSADRLTDAATGELRTAHVRRSLTEVYRCLRLADVTMADVDRVLVVGGAARPPEVAAVLAEALARPVVVAREPERTIAEGAAILARRAAEVAHGDAVRRRRAGRARTARVVRRRVVRAAALVGAAVAAVALLAAVPGDCARTTTGSLGAVLQSDTDTMQSPHGT